MMYTYKVLQCALHDHLHCSIIPHFSNILEVKAFSISIQYVKFQLLNPIGVRISYYNV
jgi:hypothetical protein